MPLAEEYRRLGRRDEAAEVLETTLKAQPRHTAVQVALGRCRLEVGDPQGALDVLRDVLERDPLQLVANQLVIESLIEAGQAGTAGQRLHHYQALNARDQNDSTRATSPLKLAPGAVYIDTTSLGVDEVVARVLALVDDDCELVPIVTCCGECKPAPPFESVPRSAIDTLLLETEERCLRDDRPCPVCARPPRGCTASPRCAQGTCTFTATGCDFPNT